MGGTDAFGIITDFSMKLLKYSTPASGNLDILK